MDVRGDPGASSGRHPGWPSRLGPLRVGTGGTPARSRCARSGCATARAWSAIRIRDERHLAPWEPTPPGGWAQRNAPASGRAGWYQLRAAARRGMPLPFAITVDGRLAGHVMVGNVVREPLLSAYVGYWCDSRLAGGGVTTAAVALVVDHCFGPVRLHRLEATVRPENAASLRVLDKLGLPAGGRVPALPRRRRRLARPPLLRDDRRGAADRRD